MTYQEATEYLFCKTSNFEHQGVGGYKEGLENTLKLDEHFGHPHEHFRSIHIQQLIYLLRIEVHRRTFCILGLT